MQEKQRPYEAMMAAKKISLEGHGRRQLRSLNATYNCVGMVFANRRTCIDADHVPMILKDDGYVEVLDLEKVVAGDVIVYEDPQTCEVLHVGRVVSNQKIFSERQIRILSQFGRDGEYFHDHTDIPQVYGKHFKFYSERRNEDEPWATLTS
ncbi:MAG: hypothetical protein SFV51_30055 [Bryobacteraceae bacterium]|nr:hypothetical protein [Bryobacteraceae bacterium]